MRNPNTIKVPESPCPYCNAPLRFATPVEDKTIKPREGDFTVCIECKGIVAFNADLTLRPTTAKDKENVKRAFANVTANRKT